MNEMRHQYVDRAACMPEYRSLHEQRDQVVERIREIGIRLELARAAFNEVSLENIQATTDLLEINKRIREAEE